MSSSGVPGGTSTVTVVRVPSASRTVTVRRSALAGDAGTVRPTSVAAAKAAVSSTKRNLLLIRAEVLLPVPLRESPGRAPSYQNIRFLRVATQEQQSPHPLACKRFLDGKVDARNTCCSVKTAPNPRVEVEIRPFHCDSQAVGYCPRGGRRRERRDQGTTPAPG